MIKKDNDLMKMLMQVKQSHLDQRHYLLLNFLTVARTLIEKLKKESLKSAKETPYINEEALFNHQKKAFYSFDWG